MSQDQLNDSLFKLDSRTISLISYLTIFGWVVALVLHGNNPSRLAAFHLRQSLGVLLTWVVLSFIPVIGWLLALPVLYLWACGIYYAFTEQKHVVPVLGDFYQQSFKTLID
ncbi:DUF4870 domain-containing protein [Thalassotalea maritima]|uniref:DUF4870 domain-containing protein n=1 Tax=Thalassotalea maritima TaxID=3242416 RepID=UPI003526D590